MADKPVPWTSVANLPEEAAFWLDRLRQVGPRVHAITNAAAQTLTANLLLAAGAIPSLTVAPDEIESFTSSAAALLVNLGTLDPERRSAIPRAIAVARNRAKPWVLDPVFANASPLRLDMALSCLAERPAVMRCNAQEFSALAGAAPEPEELRAFARRHGTVVALTGAVDLVTDGERSVAIRNGHPLMTRVTAMGCAATALVAALAALGAPPVEAAAAALLIVGVAGELAAEQSRGPGTFQPAFLDTLFGLDRAAIVSRARIA